MFPTFLCVSTYLIEHRRSRNNVKAEKCFHKVKRSLWVGTVCNFCWCSSILRLRWRIPSLQRSPFNLLSCPSVWEHSVHRLLGRLFVAVFYFFSRTKEVELNGIFALTKHGRLSCYFEWLGCMWSSYVWSRTVGDISLTLQLKTWKEEVLLVIAHRHINNVLFCRWDFRRSPGRPNAVEQSGKETFVIAFLSSDAQCLTYLQVKMWNWPLV